MYGTTIFAAALAGLVASNSVPIFGTYPGWIQGGNKLNIEVEIFIDLLCYDSMVAYPQVKAALETNVADGITGMEAISLRISSFPLDYHVHSW